VSQQKNPTGNESIVHFFSEERTSSNRIKFVKQLAKKEPKRETKKQGNSSFPTTKASPKKTGKQMSKN